MHSVQLAMMRFRGWRELGAEVGGRRDPGRPIEWRSGEGPFRRRGTPPSAKVSDFQGAAAIPRSCTPGQSAPASGALALLYALLTRIRETRRRSMTGDPLVGGSPDARMWEGHAQDRASSASAKSRPTAPTRYVAWVEPMHSRANAGSSSALRQHGRAPMPDLLSWTARHWRNRRSRSADARAEIRSRNCENHSSIFIQRGSRPGRC